MLQAIDSVAKQQTLYMIYMAYKRFEIQDLKVIEKKNI